VVPSRRGDDRPRTVSAARPDTRERGNAVDRDPGRGAHGVAEFREALADIRARTRRGYEAGTSAQALVARHARLVGRTLANLPSGSRLPWHRVVNAALRISERGDDRAMDEQRRRLEREGIAFVGPRRKRRSG